MVGLYDKLDTNLHCPAKLQPPVRSLAIQISDCACYVSFAPFTTSPTSDCGFILRYTPYISANPSIYALIQIEIASTSRSNLAALAVLPLYRKQCTCCARTVFGTM